MAGGVSKGKAEKAKGFDDDLTEEVEVGKNVIALKVVQELFLQIHFAILISITGP